jgi:SpoVK/Ycf46/Vps4 family AAA+-type ATPase
LEDLDKFTTFQSGAGDHQDAGEVTLHALLKAIDGVDQPDGVLLIATTNYPGQLSEALMNRPGRFDRVWEFKKPEPPEIKKMLLYHKVEMTDGTMDKVLKELHGYSMAFAEDFVKSVKLEHKKSSFVWSEVSDTLNRIHRHNELYKTHFEGDRPPIGFLSKG